MWEVLSFNYVGLGNWMHMVWLGGELPHSLSHLAGLYLSFDPFWFNNLHRCYKIWVQSHSFAQILSFHNSNCWKGSSPFSAAISKRTVQLALAISAWLGNHQHQSSLEGFVIQSWWLAWLLAQCGVTRKGRFSEELSSFGRPEGMPPKDFLYGGGNLRPEYWWRHFVDCLEKSELSTVRHSNPSPSALDCGCNMTGSFQLWTVTWTVNPMYIFSLKFLSPRAFHQQHLGKKQRQTCCEIVLSRGMT